MKFLALGDFRRGRVTLNSRVSEYDYASFRQLKRTLGMGRSGELDAGLQTFSEFVRYMSNTSECDGLVFKSSGAINVPRNASQGHAYVDDVVNMAIRITEACAVRLKASVTGDLDRSQMLLTLTGPSFSEPVSFGGTHDQTHKLQPGDYVLKAGYELAAILPDGGLSGKSLTIEMQVSLTPAS